jgi:hypothetical protein
MPERVTDEDQELLVELGVDTAPAASGGRTAREQRIIAGFEEIEKFVAEHGRAPEHGENRDIFERLYAVRLDRIRESAECREVLKDIDSRGLLGVGNRSGETLTESKLRRKSHSAIHVRTSISSDRSSSKCSASWSPASGRR